MVSIVCFVGLSCVGKTTVSRELSKKMGCGFFSTGNYERGHARALGHNDVVDYEKKLGLQRAYIDLFPEMYNEIETLSLSNVIIMVEGVYSPLFYSELLKRFNPENVDVISITSPRNLRIRRFSTREGVSIPFAKRRIRLLDKGKYEVGINEMLMISRKNAFANRSSLENLFNKLKMHIIKIQDL